jgi:hypothetical protein
VFTICQPTSVTKEPVTLVRVRLICDDAVYVDKAITIAIRETNNLPE